MPTTCTLTPSMVRLSMRDPTSGAVCPSCSARFSSRPRGFCGAVWPIRRACGRKPLPAETVSAVSGTPHQAPARHRRHPHARSYGFSHWFDWPSDSRHRTTRDLSTVAAPGVAPVVADGPSCPGRPPIPVELQALIRQMARENLRLGSETYYQRTTAEARPAGLSTDGSQGPAQRISIRAPGHRVPVQRWRTFVRNHAWDLTVQGMSVDVYPKHASPVCTPHPVPPEGVVSTPSRMRLGAPSGHAVAMPLLCRPCRYLSDGLRTRLR